MSYLKKWHPVQESWGSWHDVPMAELTKPVLQGAYKKNIQPIVRRLISSLQDFDSAAMRWDLKSAAKHYSDIASDVYHLTNDSEKNYPRKWIFFINKLRRAAGENVPG